MIDLMERAGVAMNVRGQFSDPIADPKVTLGALAFANELGSALVRIKAGQQATPALVRRVTLLLAQMIRTSGRFKRSKYTGMTRTGLREYRGGRRSIVRMSTSSSASRNACCSNGSMINVRRAMVAACSGVARAEGRCRKRSPVIAAVGAARSVSRKNTFPLLRERTVAGRWHSVSTSVVRRVRDAARYWSLRSRRVRVGKSVRVAQDPEDVRRTRPVARKPWESVCRTAKEIGRDVFTTCLRCWITSMVRCRTQCGVNCEIEMPSISRADRVNFGHPLLSHWMSLALRVSRANLSEP